MISLRKKIFTGVIASAAIVTALVPTMQVLAASTFDPSANLKISGSTTVMPIVGYLTSTTNGGLPSSTGFFQSTTGGSGAIVQTFAEGSGVGKSEVVSGIANLGMSSSDYTTATDVLSRAIARDGVCVILNNSVSGVTNLTKAQIKGIYEGTITNWSTVGGPSAAIVPLAREITSGTYDTLMKTVPVSTSLEQAYIPAGNRYTTTALLEAAVGSTANSIGYVGIGYLSSLGNSKVVSVEGIEATEQTITKNTYPLSRYLWLLTKAGTTPAQYAAAFKDYVLTDAGQQAVKTTGFVRLNPAQDANADNKINISDVVKVGLHWNEVPASAGWTTGGAECDVNRDGRVNISDVVSVGLWWNIQYTIPTAQW